MMESPTFGTPRDASGALAGRLCALGLLLLLLATVLLPRTPAPSAIGTQERPALEVVALEPDHGNEARVRPAPLRFDLAAALSADAEVEGADRD